MFEQTATKSYDKIFNKLIKKYGDELGTQYGVELQKAISDGSIKVLQNWLFLNPATNLAELWVKGEKLLDPSL